MGADFIPYGSQWINEDDLQAVQEVLTSSYLTTGPAVAAFEQALAAYVGVEFAVAVSNGTAALHAAYSAAGLGPGDEIITTPLTFAATANAARYLGATVRFADVCPRTGNLDPQSVAAVIGPRTKLMVPVDFAGHPADWDGFRELSEKTGVPLVGDCAHALGADYNGEKACGQALLSTTSFHPVKPITTGEGGAVFTNDADLADRLRAFRSHGLVFDAAKMRRPGGPWHREMQSLGYNYRLTDLQSALGTSQLKRLDDFIARRRHIAGRYQAAFGKLSGVDCPVVLDGVRPGWHLYTLRVQDAQHRLPLFERLRSRGLGVQVHYEPVHHHPYYADLGHRPEEHPNAVHFSSRTISLPIFPKMTDAQIERVIHTVVEAVARVVS